MHPQNDDGSRTPKGGTRLFDAQLAGSERRHPINRARQAQAVTSPWKVKRLNDQVARNAYAEAKRLALQALTAAHKWEQDELRERSRAAWALFKQATLEAGQ